ncbi:MAG: four-carbon acid sugar kinase family protein [Planctomycetota bacterium]|jgi:uncharacterized protein YgbK (DUF1537 family)
MIVVIADDFTGAAELAAIAMCHGLKTEIQTELDTNTNAELLVIDTDTRSMQPQQALEKISQTLDKLRSVRPQWFYKKTDSVMRGPVLAELEALLENSNFDRILFIPANASFGRTIKGGTYFINNVPLDKTDFANDPEHPARSANVIELLGPSDLLKIISLTEPQSIPTRTISIGDAQTKNDLDAWAEKLNDKTIAAGGADFFTAILESKGFSEKRLPQSEAINEETTALFVCTSGSGYSGNAVKKAETNSIPVIKMPRELFKSQESAEFVQKWADEAMTALLKNRCAIITIGEPKMGRADIALKLRQHTATVVERILNTINIDQLYIEGGATASAIVRKIGLKRFIPVEKLAPGVVKMTSGGIKNLHITIKPGSYPWPDNLWQKDK